MAERQITKKKKGFLIKYPGTKGQTFYGGSSNTKKDLVILDMQMDYLKKQNHYISCITK